MPPASSAFKSAAHLLAAHAATPSIPLEQIESTQKTGSQKERFLNFASVYRKKHKTKYLEHYMTPHDFISSITDQVNLKKSIEFNNYQSKIFQKQLFDKKLEDLNNEYIQTGEMASLFQNFNNQGLLSYCDYIFLLTVLSKSEDYRVVL